MVARVGIRELQQHASAVVRRAAEGEIIEVTDRGRPVARLVPMEGGSLAAAVRAGLADPARQRPIDLPAPGPEAPGRPTLTEILARLRAAERY